MADKITIISKKAFQFKNPRFEMVRLKNVSPDGTTKEASSDKEITAKLEEAVFRTIPGAQGRFGDPQQAPDWIKTDLMFGWAVKDGDLLVVENVTPAAAAAVAKQGEKAEEEQKAAEKESESQHEADLKAMSKADLLDHAQAEHGLDLSPAMKKDDIVKAIQEAKKEKE